MSKTITLIPFMILFYDPFYVIYEERSVLLEQLKALFTSNFAGIQASLSTGVWTKEENTTSLSSSLL